MLKKIVAGNWKMNGSKDFIQLLLQALRYSLPTNNNVECIIFPPAIYLPLVKELLQDSSLKWGSQNIYPANAGAFTGELSAAMFLEYGCQYVLVGHSERRQILGESEKFVAEKFHHVKEHGMIPILCVGETLAEREQGKTKVVLARQIKAVAELNQESFSQSIIAYEPVWAIGTGKTALPEQVQVTHLMIRQLIADMSQVNPDTVPILYGGSVNEHNAADLFSMSEIDGGLIGGASLNARQFLEIVKCIN